MSPEEIESLMGSAPVAPELPEVPAGAVSQSEPIPAVDTVDPLRTDGPTLAEYVQAGYSADNYPPQGYAPKAEPGPRVRQYVPCTGQQISKFLAAVNGGMKDAHYASEHDIDTFLATS